jgi:DNA-binding MarR family transcriptional regulator
MPEDTRPSLPPLRERISFLVHRINAHLLRSTNPLLKVWKIDLTESRMMVAILENGPMAAGEIVALMALPQSTISHQLKRLERLGYITRVPGERDSRMIIASLTDLGRQVATEGNAHSRLITDQLLAAIGVQESEQIRAALQRVDAALAPPLR